MKKICLIGADGQLGTEITLAINGLGRFECTPLTINDLDILNTLGVDQFFSQNQFDFVINCAAYTAVDLAEKEKEINNSVNNLAVKSLAKACNAQDAILIHISTDFVFDGTNYLPMKEEDSTNPIQEYGRAKLAGEKWVNNGIVIRTSWLYSPFGNNFAKTMLHLGTERETLHVVDNQVGTPTYAFDLAQAILTICEDEKVKEKTGIYHFSNEGLASWFDFAQSIMEYGEVDCIVLPIPDSAYPTPAKRPKYSVLDKTKIKNQFEIKIPYWRESVKACIQRIKEDESRN